jgi:hypothetical protein
VSEVRGTQKVVFTRLVNWNPPEGWRIIQISAGTWIENMTYPKTWPGCWILLQKD